MAINSNKHTIKHTNMKVDAREILFIRQNAPHGMIKTLADNIGRDYSSVRTEIYALKDDYDERLVIEARRLLEANTGLVYNAQVA